MFFVSSINLTYINLFMDTLFLLFFFYTYTIWQRTNARTLKQDSAERANQRDKEDKERTRNQRKRKTAVQAVHVAQDLSDHKKREAQRQAKRRKVVPTKQESENGGWSCVLMWWLSTHIFIQWFLDNVPVILSSGIQHEFCILNFIFIQDSTFTL